MAAEYFDTTVAVSALFTGSKNHSDALARLQAAAGNAFMINHGLAEAYRVLTGPLRVPPESAAVLIEDMARLIQEAALSRAEYRAEIGRAGARNMAGPIIYDMLHAAGARKVKATTLHTYNPAHFAIVAPDLNVV